MTTLSYEPHPRTIHIESPSPDSLRIVIPRYYPHPNWRHPRDWAIGFALPPAFCLAALIFYRDIHVALDATAAGIGLLLLTPLFGLLSRPFNGSTITIQVTPSLLTVHRQFRNSATREVLPRTSLKALDVRKQYDPIAWSVRVLGTYKWISLTDPLPRKDAHHIATHLRALLQLPAAPS